MDFGMTETQEDVRRNVKAVCDRFDDAYWSAHDDSGEFPLEFNTDRGGGFDDAPPPAVWAV